MKNEFKEKINSEFVGLKSKMYFLVDVDGRKNKKAKGGNKNVAKNIRHKKFVDVFFNKKRIQSKLHRIGTYDVSKFFLSSFDDKRYILHNDVNSLTYFHKHIRSQIIGQSL